MIFYLLSNTLPFAGQDDMITRKYILIIYRNILQNQLKFESSKWSNVTNEGREIVTLLIQKDPTKRIELNSIISHKWFKICLINLK